MKKTISQSDSLTEEQLERSFEDLWKTKVDEILNKIDRKEKDIKASVQSVITAQLGPNSVYKYNKKKNNSLNMYDEKGFDLLDSHLTRGNPSRLKKGTRKIIDQSSSHCEIVTEGKEYDQQDAEILFNELLMLIKQLKEEGLDTSQDYEMDLIIYMEKLAVRNFTLNQTIYEEKSSLQALLQKKKRSYYMVFTTKLGQVEMMNSFLKYIVEGNLQDRLTNTELIQILRDHDGDVFRNTQVLQASIMIDLFAKNTFEGYHRYITQYEDVIKETLTKRSIEILEKDNRLKKLAKSKLNTIIEELKEAIKKTDESPNKDFLVTLFSNMKGLTKSHNDFKAYEMITFDGDKAEFAMILNSQLTGSIHEQFIKDIDTWEVISIIYKKRLTDFAFKEVVGCTATCPLCRVPCDAHSGGNTSGKHRATLHRPIGLGLMIGTESRQLINYNCNEAVASQKVELRTKTGQWIKLKDYRDMDPDWIIEPSTDIDREVFWKRVLRDFNEDFARHYKVSKANLPHWWYKIQDHNVEEDLVKNYGISRDEIRRKLSKAKCKTNE